MNPSKEVLELVNNQIDLAGSKGRKLLLFLFRRERNDPALSFKEIDAFIVGKVDPEFIEFVESLPASPNDELVIEISQEFFKNLPSGAAKSQAKQLYRRLLNDLKRNGDINESIKIVKTVLGLVEVPFVRYNPDECSSDEWLNKLNELTGFSNNEGIVTARKYFFNQYMSIMDRLDESFLCGDINRLIEVMQDIVEPFESKFGIGSQFTELIDTELGINLPKKEDFIEASQKPISDTERTRRDLAYSAIFSFVHNLETMVLQSIKNSGLEWNYYQNTLDLYDFFKSLVIFKRTPDHIRALVKPI